jgi:hypothetical protein
MRQLLDDILLTRRAALIAGALACFLVASFLFLFAADVTRWRDALPADDVRYVVDPEADDLWQADELLPVGVARIVAGVSDDVQIRRAIRALRLARLEEGTVSDPQLALVRNDALARLEAFSTGDADPVRRSRAAGLLGALGLARLASETQDRAAILEGTVASLQYALNLDPDNREAKFNLELALQRGRGIQITEGAGGQNPTPGGAGSKGAGAGDAGSGY